MKKLKTFKVVLLVLVTLNSITVSAQETITFPSLDKLTITADLYKINDSSKYIVLCHLSEHSRGEYIQTAKKLNTLGFNCLAIDTRTGTEIFEVKNQTAIAAKTQNKKTDYLSSEQDILAAINYADSLSNGKGIILLGSSFSASLSLKIGVKNKKVASVIAFSPGENFGKALNLKKAIKKLNKPVFVSSSKEEAAKVTVLISDIKSKDKTQFIPIEKGAHGSIALWTYNANHQEYWEALSNFLAKNK